MTNESTRSLSAGSLIQRLLLAAAPGGALTRKPIFLGLAAGLVVLIAAIGYGVHLRNRAADPAAIGPNSFRNVQTFVLQNCATSECHAAEKPGAGGNFRLISLSGGLNNPTAEQQLYTNFYIMAMYANKDGKIDKEERAKMTKEDKEKWQSLSGGKKKEKKAAE